MQYKKIKILGKGAYGKVYLVEKQCEKKDINRCENEGGTTELYALKSLEKNKDCIVSFNTEIKLLKQLDHINVIKLYDSYENDFKLNIILEYAEKGNLGQEINKKIKFLKKYQDSEIKNIILSITNGLEHLHKHNIIHRDIKPENILISKNNIYKISDFGVSRIDNNTKLIKTSIGTPYYMAPEIIKGKPYNKEIDCWALGCIFYELCTLKVPFTGENMYILSSRICRGYISVYNLPVKYRSLITLLLNVDKYKRGKLVDIIDFFKHNNIDTENKNLKKNNYVTPNRYNNILPGINNQQKENTPVINKINQPKVNKQIINKVNQTKVHTPVINKFNQQKNYTPYINKNYHPQIYNPIVNSVKDYRKKKPNFYRNKRASKEEINEYYKNRKPFFY